MVNSNKSIKNFWIAFLGILTVLFIATSIFTFVTLTNQLDHKTSTMVPDDNMYKVNVENTYHQALYDACDSLKNIDASLSKTVVSNQTSNQVDFLINTAALAVNLNSDISRLPTNQGEIIENIEKYTNQLMEYSKSLVKKLANGENLTFADKTALASLDSTAQALYNSFKEILDENSGMFVTNSLFTDGANTVGDSMDNMDTNIFNYQKLEYQGPFSDDIVEKPIVAKKSMTKEQGIQLLEEVFADQGVVSVEFSDIMKSKGTFYVYNIETEEGAIRAILTTDGRVVELDYYVEGEQSTPTNSDTQSTYDAQNTLQIAQQFAQKLGFDVQGIWVSKVLDSTTYVNLAPIVDGVILYPDLVKIAVDTSTGKVVGLESRAFLTNHVDRDLNFDEFAADDFVNQFEGMPIMSVNKAIILKNDKEFKCYQFEVEMAGNSYFVYIDSVTGQEIEIFKIIKDAQGFTVL